MSSLAYSPSLCRKQSHMFLRCNRQQSLRQQGGFVLIVCLFFLLAVASLGIFGLRSVTLGERSAGNSLEKQRSLRAAESAIGYGEWWLSRNNLSAPVECTTTVNGNKVSLMRVCINALTSPASLPWTGGSIYTPAAMNVSVDAGLASNGDVNYQQPPQLYIHYLGANRRGTFYSVSGSGFGGNESTASVLQSTFSFNLNSIDLGGL